MNMGRDALPCIVCSKPLENVIEDADNQANDGICFTSFGQYGSTAFDPMDGSALEINICDACIVQAALLGQVGWRKLRVPILKHNDVLPIPTLVGFQEVNRPMVPWDGNSLPDHQVDVIWED